MDQIDCTLGETSWHEEGTADDGDICKGTGAGFIEWVSAVHETMTRTSHQVSNIIIDVAGDTATSEAYVTACLRMHVQGVLCDQIVRGRYLDQWSRRGGRWAIVHRRYAHDLDHTYPLPLAAA